MRIAPILAIIVTLLFSLSAVLVLRSFAEGPPEDEARELVVLYRDVMARHPDLDLAQARANLAEYLQIPEWRRARRLDELRAGYYALVAQCERATLGPAASAVAGEDAPPLKTFTPNGFRLFYETVTYPDTLPPGSPPEIMGSEQADRRIRAIAEGRGYRLRPLAVEEALRAEGRHRLHPLAWEAWNRMRAAAERDGVRLGLVSAYRSPDRQRAIFVSLLAQRGKEAIGREYRAADVADGAADEAVDGVLVTASIPGYSKHHTGFTIDITDLDAAGPFTGFGATEGFAWMSALNYHNAKRFGFLPSYPEGAENQGPDPEPWEYVWVGVERLLQRNLPPSS